MPRGSQKERGKAGRGSRTWDFPEAKRRTCFQRDEVVSCVGFHGGATWRTESWMLAVALIRAISVEIVVTKD